MGVTLSVLKAHEGSAAERAQLVGEGALGGVLNSPVGGANPEAVEVVARLGGRVVWMPTMSAPAHQAATASPELHVLRAVRFRQVDVVTEGRLELAWYEVLEVVADHDLVLASGHLTRRFVRVRAAVARVRMLGRG